MMRLFTILLVVSCLAEGAWAQKIIMEKVSGDEQVLELKDISRLRFVVNGDTMYDHPNPTTMMWITGNLNAAPGPKFTSMPGTPEEYWQVEDVNGNTASLLISFIKYGEDLWYWEIIDLDGFGTFSDFAGWLSIDNDGSILRSETHQGASSITYQCASGVEPILVYLPPENANVMDEPDDFAYTIGQNGSAIPSIFVASYQPDIYDVTAKLYDSLGGVHLVTVRFEKTMSYFGMDKWDWHVHLVTGVDPASEFISKNDMKGFQGEGMIIFTSDGLFDTLITGKPIVVDPEGNASPVMINAPDMSAITQYVGAYSLQMGTDGNPFAPK